MTTEPTEPTELPIAAQRYLANLADGLRTLPRHERDSLILELRAHFQALRTRGDTAIDSAIADLGPAQALAAAFVAARPAGGIAVVPPPVEAPAAPPFTVRAAVRESLATLRGADERLHTAAAVLLATIAATDFMAFLAAHHADAALPRSLTMALRLAGLVVALVAAYRILLPGAARPWQLDRPLLRYVGAALALLALVGACQFAVARGLLPLLVGGLAPGAALATKALLVGLVTLGCAAAALRLQPWLVALATGRSGLDAAGSWRGMRGKTRSLIGGWAVLVLPLFALHLAISAAALAVADPALLLALAGIDAIVATLQALLATALLVTAYRWVVDLPLPAAAPFSTAAPDPAGMAAARRMLLDAIDARYERQRRPAPAAR